MAELRYITLNKKAVKEDAKLMDYKYSIEENTYTVNDTALKADFNAGDLKIVYPLRYSTDKSKIQTIDANGLTGFLSIDQVNKTRMDEIVNIKEGDKEIKKFDHPYTYFPTQYDQVIYEYDHGIQEYTKDQVEIAKKELEYFQSIDANIKEYYESKSFPSGFKDIFLNQVKEEMGSGFENLSKQEKEEKVYQKYTDALISGFNKINAKLDDSNYEEPKNATLTEKINHRKQWEKEQRELRIKDTNVQLLLALDENIKEPMKEGKKNESHMSYISKYMSVLYDKKAFNGMVAAQYNFVMYDKEKKCVHTSADPTDWTNFGVANKCKNGGLVPKDQQYYLESLTDRDKQVCRFANRAFAETRLKEKYDYKKKIEEKEADTWYDIPKPLLDEKRELEARFKKSYDTKAVIKEQVDKHNGLLLAEDHSQPYAKDWLKDNMRNMKEAGIHTLYVEHLLSGTDQRLIDEYFDQKTDEMNPVLAQRFKDPMFQGLKDVIVKAKETGMRVVGLGSELADYSGMKESHDRALMFNQYAEEFIKKDQEKQKTDQKGYVVLAGDAHLIMHEGKTTDTPIRGLAQIFNMQALKPVKDGLEVITDKIKIEEKIPGVATIDLAEYQNKYLSLIKEGESKTEVSVSQDAFNAMDTYRKSNPKSLAQAAEVIKNITGVSVLGADEKIQKDDMGKLMHGIIVNGVQLHDVMKNEGWMEDKQAAIHNVAGFLTDHFDLEKQNNTVNIAFLSEGKMVPLTYLPKVPDITAKQPHFYSRSATKARYHEEVEAREKAIALRDKWEVKNNKAKMACAAYNDVKKTELTSVKQLQKEENAHRKSSTKNTQMNKTSQIVKNSQGLQASSMNVPKDIQDKKEHALGNH